MKQAFVDGILLADEERGGEGVMLALVRMRATAARKRALREYAQQRSAAKPAFF